MSDQLLIARRLANVLANLGMFGISDPLVLGVVNITQGRQGGLLRTVDFAGTTLSTLCVQSEKLRGSIELDKEANEHAAFRIRVLIEDSEIGFIDSDGRFHYSAARTLCVALGWAVATDLGRDKVLDYDLAAHVAALSNAIGYRPDAGRFDEFSRAFAIAMAKDTGSRFGDGRLGFLNLLWRIGTHTLQGQEQESIPFMS